MWRKGDLESVFRARRAEDGLKYPFKGADGETSSEPEDGRDGPVGRDGGVCEDPSDTRTP